MLDGVAQLAAGDGVEGVQGLGQQALVAASHGGDEQQTDGVGLGELGLVAEAAVARVEQGGDRAADRRRLGRSTPGGPAAEAGGPRVRAGRRFGAAARGLADRRGLAQCLGMRPANSRTCSSTDSMRSAGRYVAPVSAAPAGVRKAVVGQPPML